MKQALEMSFERQGLAFGSLPHRTPNKNGNRLHPPSYIVIPLVYLDRPDSTASLYLTSKHGTNYVAYLEKGCRISFYSSLLVSPSWGGDVWGTSCNHSLQRKEVKKLKWFSSEVDQKVRH